MVITGSKAQKKSTSILTQGSMVGCLIASLG
jgi:hypothetical protein